MSSHSAAAEAAARRLMAGATGPTAAGSATEDPEATARRVLAAEQVSTDVGTALGRWFGPYGYHAILSRALTQAQARHRSLAGVSIRAPLVPVLDGLTDAAAAHGGHQVAEGVTDVLTGVVGLLARVIGEDMALQLVERSMEEPDREDPAPTRPADDAGRGTTT